MKIVFVFSLPHKKLNPNQQYKNHMAHARLKKERKWSIKMDSIRQIRVKGLPDNMKWEKATVSIKWYAATMNFPDGDNALASLKSTIDGICAAGLLLDDNHLLCSTPKFYKDAKHPRVEMTFTKTRTANEAPGRDYIAE